MKMEEIQKLINDGVTLEQISEELNYREMASADSAWDDDLYGYTTSELEEFESELIKRKS